jgi:hypothetical protein
MLVAQLHAHPGKQFGGLPGRGDHVVCSQIQSARAQCTAAVREQNHARVGGGSKAFNLSKRAAAEDIGEVGSKQEHIHTATLNEFEPIFLRSR